MTTLQIHLLMLALGLLAFWLLGGAFRNRKSFSTRLRRQWWLGAVAGIAVAASPLSRFWRIPDTNIELLTQSLLISAVFLLALLLLALLRGPFTSFRNSAAGSELMINGHTKTEDQGTDLLPIVINADASSVSANNLVTDSSSISVTPEQTSTTLSQNTTDINDTDATRQVVTVDKSRDDTKTPADVSVDADTNGNVNADTTKHASDQGKITQRHVKDIESVVPLHNKHDATQTLDESISSTNAANDNERKEKLSLADDPFDNPISDTLSVEEELDLPSIPSDAERLDLSETEQLFAEIRAQQNDVELPNEEELRQAKQTASIDKLDLEGGVVVDDEASLTQKTEHTTAVEAEIEEAEVVDVDDTDLEFGNDLTGEYSHPSVQSNDSVRFVDSDHSKTLDVPETLDEALIAAKLTAISLQSNVSSLEENILELDKLRDSAIKAAEENTAGQQLMLQEKEALLQSEDQARRAAESVIAAQSALIDQAKRQQSVVNTLLTQERARLNELQLEITRSRKMARTAANLARRAAIAQQEIRDVAIREQNARLKSQESTRKAVTIARNAISALAAEERKRDVTRH